VLDVDEILVHKNLAGVLEVLIESPQQILSFAPSNPVARSADKGS
jgi:hypothetical protein